MSKIVERTRIIDHVSLRNNSGAGPRSRTQEQDPDIWSYVQYISGDSIEKLLILICSPLEEIITYIYVFNYNYIFHTKKNVQIKTSNTYLLLYIYIYIYI